MNKNHWMPLASLSTNHRYDSNLPLAQAQNATSITNTTTTETNTTVPLDSYPMPVFPEPKQWNDRQSKRRSNEAEQAIESKDNATRVIGLLDDAQIKIDEARDSHKRTSGTDTKRVNKPEREEQQTILSK